tara:strand:- start:1093 stop:1293 length:201 start_codon:yes stop_codon:yes gene_type:complete
MDIKELISFYEMKGDKQIVFLLKKLIMEYEIDNQIDKDPDYFLVEDSDTDSECSMTDIVKEDIDTL